MLTRRAWIERAALYAAAAAAGGLWPLRIEAGQTAGMPGTDSVLTNGRFVDSRGVIADTITIRNGRIARRIESVLTMVGGRVVHASDRFVTAEVRP